MTEAPPTVQDPAGLAPGMIPAPPAEWTKSISHAPAYGFKLDGHQGLFIWQYRLLLTDGKEVTAHSTRDLRNAERNADSEDRLHMISIVEGQVMIHFDKQTIRYDHIKLYERYVRKVDEYQAKALI